MGQSFHWDRVVLDPAADRWVLVGHGQGGSCREEVERHSQAAMRQEAREDRCQGQDRSQDAERHCCTLADCRWDLDKHWAQQACRNHLGHWGRAHQGHPDHWGRREGLAVRMAKVAHAEARWAA